MSALAHALFFPSFRMICLRAIIYHRDVLDSSNYYYYLFIYFQMFFFHKYRIPVMYWLNYTGYHQVGWLSNSGSIKK